MKNQCYCSFGKPQPGEWGRWALPYESAAIIQIWLPSSAPFVRISYIAESKFEDGFCWSTVSYHSGSYPSTAGCIRNGRSLESKVPPNKGSTNWSYLCRPGSGTMRLKNFLVAVSGDVIEVVSPIKQNTTAGKLLSNAARVATWS